MIDVMNDGGRRWWSVVKKERGRRWRSMREKDVRN